MRIFPPNSPQNAFMLHLSPRSSHHPASPNCLSNLLIAAALSLSRRHVAQIHARIVSLNLSSHSLLFNNLLNSYAKCGRIDQSLLVISSTDHAFMSVVSFTSLINLLSRLRRPFRALMFFNRMRSSAVCPNHFTFSAVLPACADTAVLFHGEQMHCLILKHGFHSYVFVGSALVDMYAKCGKMWSAEKMFGEMPDRNLVSWNSMIVGLLHNKLYKDSVCRFREVLREELIVPDQVSFSTVLSACANTGSLEAGKQVHGVVVKHGLTNLPYVKNSLMDMYIKCGFFADAAKLFRMVAYRDVVSWNVMLMGHVHNQDFEEACTCFWAMRREGALPDEGSYSTALHASARLAAIGQGTLIHDHVIKTGYEDNTCVQSSLITMYAKCGSLSDARQVFNEIEKRNIVCWSAMIAACQQHGSATKAIELFEEMLREGMKPDYITFVSVLSACAHSGRVQEGLAYFDSMTNIHGVSPGHEHYACIVDLFSRTGRLEEAKKVIKSMPIQPDSSVWGALLGGCASYGNLEIGKEAAGKLFELEPDNPGNYMLLANLYSRNGKLKEADEVRRSMGLNRVRKEPGCSWIDVNGKTFVFTVQDRSHPRTVEIYRMLKEVEQLVKQRGHEAETHFAINRMEQYKEQSLWHHSERLALAFGLLALPPGAPIRINKNLRTCGDCHTVMKFASEIFYREIIVRDINRFHRFTEGSCSCGDFW